MKNILGRHPLRNIATIGLLGVASLALPMAGCGNIADDRVEQICKCENCGDRNRQTYQAKVEAEINVAEIYGCDSKLTPYYQCEIQQHDCVDGHYADNDSDDHGCKHELDQYEDCLKGQSSRDPGPYEIGTHPESKK